MCLSLLRNKKHLKAWKKTQPWRVIAYKMVELSDDGVYFPLYQNNDVAFKKGKNKTKAWDFVRQRQSICKNIIVHDDDPESVEKGSYIPYYHLYLNAPDGIMFGARFTTVLLICSVPRWHITAKGVDCFGEAIVTKSFKIIGEVKPKEREYKMYNSIKHNPTEKYKTPWE